jgi:hypothetical protein
MSWTLCAEFPNDNPELWTCRDPELIAEAQAAPIEVSAVQPIEPQPAAELLEELAPPPLESVVVLARPRAPGPEEGEIELMLNASAVEEGVVEDGTEEIVVEELDFDLSDVPLESAASPAPRVEEGAPHAELERARAPEAAETARARETRAARESDGYATLVHTLRDVAVAEAGDAEAAGAVSALLDGSDAATAHAWRAVLRNEIDDISTCGAAMLDEWAADVVARAIGAPQKAGNVRRELRARGVCAFGLIEAA